MNLQNTCSDILKATATRKLIFFVRISRLKNFKVMKYRIEFRLHNLKLILIVLLLIVWIRNVFILDDSARKRTLYHWNYLRKIEKVKSTIYMALSTPYFNNNYWYHREMRDEKYFKKIKCPITDCVVHPYGHSGKHYSEYDALLFHAPSLDKHTPKPKIRSESQLYFFVSDESARFWRHVNHLDGFFNLSCNSFSKRK